MSNAKEKLVSDRDYARNEKKHASWDAEDASDKAYWQGYLDAMNQAIAYVEEQERAVSVMKDD